MGWIFRRKHLQTPAPKESQTSALVTSHDQMVGNRRFLTEPEAPYQFPRDLTDLNRLDFQHFIFRQILHGNYVAPITVRPGMTMLDVGTGTGRWAIEMAHDFPQAQVFGIDLEEAQSTSPGPVPPPNYHFQIANVLTGLPFLDASFDYVHQRALAAGIPVSQWVPEICELIRVTRPGGWIEILEGGALFTNEGPLTRKWLSLLKPLGQRAGIDFTAATTLGSFVEQAGLPCTTRQIATPLGAWGGRIGSMLQTDIMALFESVAPRLVQFALCTQSEIDTMRTGLPQEWEHYHSSLGGVLAFGQRPPLKLPR